MKLNNFSIPGEGTFSLEGEFSAIHDGLERFGVFNGRLKTISFG